jgi:hypothetical protein
MKPPPSSKEEDSDVATPTSLSASITSTFEPTTEAATHPAESLAVPISKEDMSRIRGQMPKEPKSDHETASVASNLSSTYSQVRLTLFPLYVSQVLKEWPENGRFRMAVDIDKALELVDSRPEFKAALLEVKAKGLHLAKP